MPGLISTTVTFNTTFFSPRMLIFLVSSTLIDNYRSLSVTAYEIKTSKMRPFKCRPLLQNWSGTGETSFEIRFFFFQTGHFNRCSKLDFLTALSSYEVAMLRDKSSWTERPSVELNGAFLSWYKLKTRYGLRSLIAY